MSDWLELELAHRLTPVAAPEELWDRVETGLRPAARGPRVARRRVPGMAMWRALWAAPVGTLAVVALAAGALWLADVREPALDLRQLAARATVRPARLEFESHSAGEIRGWLRVHAGLDVPLPATTTARLEGARVLRAGGRRVAAVVYRVGRDEATLLVARADPRFPLPPHGSRAAAWQARNQVYALAGANPDGADAACQLCHSSL